MTGDRQADGVRGAFEDWARAAQAITALKRTQIGLFGYPMNGMGDIRYDPPAMLRRIGPTIVNEDLGPLIERIDAVSDAEVGAVLERHGDLFEIADDLPHERHAYAA